MRKVAIIGAGAAGMTAAITAASNGAEVVVLEHMDRVGKNFRYFIFGSYEKNLITAITLPKIVTFFTMIGSIKSFSGWRRKTPSSL